MLNSFRIYGNEQPLKGDYVSIKFMERNSLYLRVKLIDYNTEGIMAWKHLTTKKHIKNINKIAPLNKKLIALVDDIIDDNIHLSLAYIDKESKEYNNYIINKNDNKKLLMVLKKTSNILKNDLNDFWKRAIYPFDIERRNQIIQTKKFITLYNFIKENIYSSSHIPDNELELIIKNISNCDTPKNIKLISKIGIISSKSILETKKLIQDTYDYMYNTTIKMKIDKVPFYVIESYKLTSSINEHKKFITKLIELSNDSPTLFVKVEQTCY